MTREQIEKEFPDEPLLFADGFDDAIIGLAERINLGLVVAYDTNRVIDILAKTMEVTESDLDDIDLKVGKTLEDKKEELATEYFYYNVVGSWVGEKTPIFVTTKL